MALALFIVFALLQFADGGLTLFGIKSRIFYEWNPIAAFCLGYFGIGGLIFLKGWAIFGGGILCLKAEKILSLMVLLSCLCVYYQCIVCAYFLIGHP